MTNTICCGGITREEEASESFPERAPDRTRNCYENFDYYNCNDCCTGDGTGTCKADPFGGYCEGDPGDDDDYGYKYFNGVQVPITLNDIRTKHSRMDELYAERDHRLRQRMRRMDQRDTINLLRQSEIMAEDRPHGSPVSPPAPPPQDSISTFFYNLGIGFSTVIILMSVFVILVHNGIIKFHK